ncbi:MAG: hypothetical protein ACLSA6_03000 [Holdemania massiliensis]
MTARKTLILNLNGECAAKIVWKKIEVALNQPIPLLLILEKDAGAEGSTSMSINDLALVLDHPEQVDADRAVLITVTFK